MTNLPKIEKCVCGSRGVITPTGIGGYFVACARQNCIGGPTRETMRDAVGAWNRFMHAARNPDGLAEAYMAGHYDGRKARGRAWRS